MGKEKKKVLGMCMRNYQRKIPFHSFVVQDEGGEDDNDVLLVLEWKNAYRLGYGIHVKELIEDVEERETKLDQRLEEGQSFNSSFLRLKKKNC